MLRQDGQEKQRCILKAGVRDWNKQGSISIIIRIEISRFIVLGEKCLTSIL